MFLEREPASLATGGRARLDVPFAPHDCVRPASGKARLRG